MRDVPTDIKLIRDKRILEITWRDEKPVCYDIKQLRCACACATCVDEMTGTRRLDVKSVSGEIGITHMELVGNYAIKFTFSDGHDTGIFTWDRFDSLPSVS